MTSAIPGFVPAVFELDPHAHNIKHSIGDGASIKGASFACADGLYINGTVTDGEEITCDGTLVIGENAKVDMKTIHAAALINLGAIECSTLRITGTLVAWSGSIRGGLIQYGAMEKSNNCKISGSLECIADERDEQGGAKAASTGAGK